MESDVSHFFTSHKKPQPKKNFIQNYNDHLNFILNDLDKHFSLDKLKREARDTPARLLYQISEETLKRLYVFDALRDGHDYLDEIGGATVAPALGMIASVGLAALSIWEGIQAIAIRLGLKKQDNKSHYDAAASSILLAGTAFVLSIISFMKASLSLFTRPFVTLINGFKQQDIKRFDVEDSVEADLKAAFN